MRNLYVRGLVHALGVAAYIFGIAGLMFYVGQRFFGPEPSFFIPVMVLMLFVISACIVGALVLGKPILLYVEGAKQQAVRLLAVTVGWIVVIVVIIFLSRVLLR